MVSTLLIGLMLLSATSLAAAPTTAAANDAEPKPPLADDRGVREALNLLEVWVDGMREYREVPGISMALVHDQELVWSNGFGHAHLASNEPAAPDTLYSICSISKLFTSIGVLQMRDAGKLRLDDPIGQHLPWFKLESELTDPPPVTVRGLLTHSAGLPRESDHSYWTGPEFPFPEKQAIVDGLANQTMLYPASRYFQYSNLGLTLAGEILAEVSGTSFADYITTNILEPLELSDTSPELPENEKGARFATGYSARPRSGKRQEMPFFQARGIAPAAGFSSSALDLAKFASWQFRLRNQGKTEVLSANTLREMHRVHWTDPDWETTWGLGFVVSRSNDKTLVGHGGSCPGFRTQLAMVPADSVAVVFMSNAMGVDTRLFTSQALEIVGPAIGKAKDAKDKPEDSTEAKPANLDRYTGLYQSAWGEQAIFEWQGSLASINLPTTRPMRALTKLKHIEGDTFRKVRKDKELGEAVTFVVNDSGEVSRMRWHGNYSEKVR